MKKYKFLEKTSLLLKEILKEKNIDKRTLPKYGNSDSDILYRLTSCAGLLGDEYLKEVDKSLSTNLYEVFSKDLRGIIKEKKEKAGISYKVLSLRVGCSLSSFRHKSLYRFLENCKDIKLSVLDRLLNTLEIELSDYITCEGIDIDNARKSAFKEGRLIEKAEYSIGAQIALFVKDMCLLRHESYAFVAMGSELGKDIISGVVGKERIPKKAAVCKLDNYFNTNMEEVLYSCVPKLLKKHRLSSGLSLRSLSALLDLNASYVSHIENGHCALGEKSERLLEFFDIKIKYLFKMNGEYFYRKPSAEVIRGRNENINYMVVKA